MKKFAILLGTTVLSSVIAVGAASAVEAGRFYIKGEANYNFATTKITTDVSQTAAAEGSKATKVIDNKEFTQNGKGVGFSGGLGCNVADQIRAEAAFHYTNLSLKPDGSSSSSSELKSEEKPKVTSWGILANAYYDLNNTGGFIPYVMAGVGYGKTNFKLPSTSDNFFVNYFGLTATEIKALSDAGIKITDIIKPTSTNNFLWNVGVGAAIELQKGIYIDIGYRFGNVGKVKFDNIKATGSAKEVYTGTVSMKNANRHAISAGLRIAF
ncbi:exported hypothetical protein [Alphaproteobacteria bacterium]